MFRDAGYSIEYSYSLYLLFKKRKDAQTSHKVSYSVWKNYEEQVVGQATYAENKKCLKISISASHRLSVNKVFSSRILKPASRIMSSISRNLHPVSLRSLSNFPLYSAIVSML